VLLLEDGIVSQTLAFALDAIATLWMLLVTLRKRICVNNELVKLGWNFTEVFVGGDGR
jgi:hypothetical protein